jgi:hypothetical protein
MIYIIIGFMFLCIIIKTIIIINSQNVILKNTIEKNEEYNIKKRKFLNNVIKELKRSKDYLTLENIKLKKTISIKRQIDKQTRIKRNNK